MPIYLVFLAAIFLSSFLLFLVQPLIAKQILPWFGGSVSVWASCMLFFQFVLLLGYSYAYLSIKFLKAKQSLILHLLLLTLSLCLLPIIVADKWQPTNPSDPIIKILILLSATIGLPYFILSSTNPLMQVWYNSKFKTSPWRLFALSNAGSLIGLLIYPLYLEPWFKVNAQANGWSIGFIAFTLLCAITATLGNFARIKDNQGGSLQESFSKVDGHLPIKDCMYWLLLTALASFSLLAITNHITQDVAPVPLLWVLPLVLYLLSFILSFDHSSWYKPKLILCSLVLIIPAMLYLESFNEVVVQVVLNLLGLFLICMLCHGEVALHKPNVSKLTHYYLIISLGGVLGGILVVLIAPLLFKHYYEFQLCLLVSLIVALFNSFAKNTLLRILILVSTIFSIYNMCETWYEKYANSILSVRNFYGTLSIDNFQEGDGEISELRHGTTSHGAQWLKPVARRKLPITYYGKQSGIGLVMQEHKPDQARNLGIIGMGTATIAAYGKAGDTIHFYEINPAVVEIANNDYYYLADTKAKVKVKLGDARITLEKENPQQFDVLAIDAFSGDAVPIHLLTSEALDIYLKHLKTDGVLLFHISNRYLALAPVLTKIANKKSLYSSFIIQDPTQQDDKMYIFESDWLIVSRNKDFLMSPKIKKATSEVTVDKHTPFWTDSYNNLLGVVNFF